MKFVDNCDKRTTPLIKDFKGTFFTQGFHNFSSGGRRFKCAENLDPEEWDDCGAELQERKGWSCWWNRGLSYKILIPQYFIQYSISQFNIQYFNIWQISPLRYFAISSTLVSSCFIPRLPLRLPTTLRTTRTRPSAAGRSGNYSRNRSQEYENKHQRPRRRGGACLVWDLWPRQGGHPQGGRQGTFNSNLSPQRKVKGEKLSKLSGTFAEGWGETIPASKKKRTLAFQFRSNKKNTAGGFRCQVTVSHKKQKSQKKVTKIANKKISK